MRRKDREIREREEIIRVMEACDVCRLALNDLDGWPYLLPLNFGLFKGESGELTLYFHGALEGKKYELMRRDGRACFEMDRGHKLSADVEKKTCTMAYESVIGRGRLSFVEDEQERLRALHCLLAHYHREDFPLNKAALPRTCVFKLKVQSLTGKARKI